MPKLVGPNPAAHRTTWKRQQICYIPSLFKAARVGLCFLCLAIPSAAFCSEDQTNHTDGGLTGLTLEHLGNVEVTTASKEAGQGQLASQRCYAWHREWKWPGWTRTTGLSAFEDAEASFRNQYWY
jgi:hypothetical protein